MTPVHKLIAKAKLAYAINQDITTYNTLNSYGFDLSQVRYTTNGNVHHLNFIAEGGNPNRPL